MSDRKTKKSTAYEDPTYRLESLRGNTRADLLKAARLYFVDGLEQSEIGEMNDWDRSKVSRLLKTARKAGVISVCDNSAVDLKLASRNTRNNELSKALEQKFNLMHATVVDVSEEFSGVHGFNAALDDKLHECLATHAAMFIRLRLRNGDHIGVGGGRAVYYIARELAKNPGPLSKMKVDVTSLTAALPFRELGVRDFPVMLDSNNVAYLLYSAFGADMLKSRGELRTISLPTAVQDPTDIRVLFDKYPAAQILSEQWDRQHPNHALLGVGIASPDYQNCLLEIGGQTMVPISEMIKKMRSLVEIIDKKVAGTKTRDFHYRPLGDTANRPFVIPPPSKPVNIAKMVDAEVRALGELSAQIDKRLIAVELHQLKAVEVVIAVAGGLGKLWALWYILTCPRYRFINVIFTDSHTARKLLEFKNTLTFPDRTPSKEYA